MRAIRLLTVFVLILVLLILGITSGLVGARKQVHHEAKEVAVLPKVEMDVGTVTDSAVRIAALAERIDNVTEDYMHTFFGQSMTLEKEIQRSEKQQDLSDDIYEQKIMKLLGEPVSTYRSPQVEIKLFELKELDYRGYMAKVKVFDPEAIEVVLADDEIGGFETTSSMARRKRAMLAINGGGFGSSSAPDGLVSSMIGGTVSKGEIIQPFTPKNEPLFFAGVDFDGRVIGTIPASQDDVDALNPKEGVSFIPVLLRDGQVKTLPSAWANTKHPRTILGRYANDDLLLIVVDGRQAYWSKGVTLERLQEKLSMLGVQDAYNLDGGGSSTLYYNGHLLNKPSDGNERPVANAIIIKP
jgi:exopolysaccharide biosynthesis protein